MKHLYIATPVYDYSVTTGYCQSMAMTIAACTKAGIALSGPDFKGSPYVEMARNLLVHQFLKSDADTLLFLDADVTWPEDAVVKLYESGLPLVGGAYPKKEERENYPVRLLNNVMLGGGYIEACYIPGGFMMIRRLVFEALIAAKVCPKYEIVPGEWMHVFFQNLYVDDGFVGEDVSLCYRWRELNGKVWCDPNIDFGHQGPREWLGNLRKCLDKRMAA